MTTERLSIEVSENGTRTVKRNIEEIGTTAKTTKAPVDALQAALDRFSRITSRINTTLNSLNGTLKSLQQGALAGSSGVDQLNKSVQGSDAVSKRAREASRGLGQQVGSTAAAMQGAASSASGLAASTASAGTALVALTGSTASAGTALVALTGSMATSSATAASLAVSQSSLVASASAAAAGQLALANSVALLPAPAAASIASMQQLSAAMAFTVAAGGGGRGFFGGAAAALGGLGAAAGRAAGVVGGALARSLGAARSALSGLGAALLDTRTLLTALIGGVVLRGLQTLSDEYTNIQNRLRLTATSQGNLNAVFNELQAVSTRTRSSLAANAELYSRIAVSAKELGVSQAELIQFTERLNKAIKVSGATTVEAENAIIQLSQGMASGTLRGDELRSVLEQLPAVADIIAKSMGVTRGQLRQLGFEGKITAEQILKAFREVGPELEAKFKKTVPTITEGFVILRNQLIETNGKIQEATGLSASFGSVLADAAKFLKDHTFGLVTMARAVTNLLDPQDEMTEGMKQFTTVIVVAEGIIRLLAQSLSSTLGLALRTVGRTLTGVVNALISAVNGDFAEAGEFLKDIWRETANDVADSSSALREKLVDSASFTVEKLVKIWDNGAREVQDRQRDALGQVGTEGGTATVAPNAQEEKALARMGRQLTTLLNRINPVAGAIREMAAAEELLIRAEEKDLITTEQLMDNLARLSLHYEDIVDPLARINRELDEEIALLQLSSREREVEAAILQMTKQLLSEGIILNEQETQSLREKLQVMQDLNGVTQAQDDLLGQSIERRRQFNDQLVAMQQLLANPNSGFAQSDANKALVDMFGEDLFANTAEFFNAQVAHYQEMFARIEQLRQADLISEQTAAAMRTRIWVASQQSQLNTAVGFFGQLSELQKSENSKIARIGKAAAIAQALVRTYQSANEAYAAMAGIPVVGPALGAAAAAAAVVAGLANVQKIRSTDVGFQTGGQFKIPGSGAPDSKTVMFRGTPGETVSVATPSQVRKGDPNRMGGGAAPSVQVTSRPQIVIVDDPRKVPAMISDDAETGDAIIVALSSRVAQLRQLLQNN